ncbi:MAG: glutamine synthetase family protein, partial [Nitrososphaerales archaeon]
VHSQEGYNLYHLLISDYITALKSMQVAPIKAHVEGGRSQLEIDVAYEEGLRAADNIVYFKDAVKAVTRQHGLLASFMPKIGHDWWGNGMHLHVSLCDSKGTNLFNAEDRKDKRELGLSDLCYHFIGGLLHHMEALCAIASPTVNSYKRILPGRWNADAITYGPGVRGAAVRIPDERGRDTRIECRFPDASCNPYLAMACIIAAGLDGIDQEIDPEKPTNFDTSYMTDSEISSKGLRLMPRSLHEALSKFEKDSLFRKTLGDILCDEYIKGKEFEIAQASDQVTQWEVEHFLDLF